MKILQLMKTFLQKIRFRVFGPGEGGRPTENQSQPVTSFPSTLEEIGIEQKRLQPATFFDPEPQPDEQGWVKTPFGRVRMIKNGLGSGTFPDDGGGPDQQRCRICRREVREQLRSGVCSWCR